MSCHYSQTRQVFVFKLFPSPATGSGPGFVVLFCLGFVFGVFFFSNMCVGAYWGCVGAAAECKLLTTGERFKGLFIEIDLSGLLG